MLCVIHVTCKILAADYTVMQEQDVQNSENNTGIIQSMW